MVSYKLAYIQNFNYGPREEMVGSGIVGCSEGIFVGSMRIKDASCTIRYDEDKKVIPDSQGFCCTCPILSVLAGVRGAGSNRGDCGFMSSPRSAHCLNYPNSWFAGYRVKEYSIEYLITITVEAEEKGGDRIVDTIYLSPSSKKGAGEHITAQIVGVCLNSQYHILV